MAAQVNQTVTDEFARPVTISGIIRLLQLSRTYWKLLLCGGILMIVSTALTLSLPLVVRGQLDQVLATQSVRGLDTLMVRFAGLIGFLFATSLAEYIILAYAGNRVVLDLRARLFSHLLCLPVSFFDRERSGNLASRLSNDVTLLQSVLTEDIIRFVGNIITLIGGVAMAVVIDWRLTGVTVGLLVLVFGAYALLAAPIRGMTRSALDALSDVIGAMTEALGNARLVKAFARENHEATRIGEKLNRQFKLQMRISVLESALGTMAGVSFLLILAGVGWYGGRGVISGQLSGGSLAAFMMTVMIISGPIAGLATLYGHLQRAVGAGDRIFDLLDQDSENVDAGECVPFPDAPLRVTFEALSFKYGGEVAVLDGFSLELAPGKSTALVGPSGCGKSTVASLLLRFYEPQQGSICVNGIGIRTMPRTVLRSRMAIVPQDSPVFQATIRENIRYGRLDATDDELMMAAKDANVHEFVHALPLGYETMVGERGVTLSAGQRQRIAIARALLKNPGILILDEATSALDTQSESLVLEALERLMEGRTTLVIAHRLNTVREADHIAVLENGRITQLGGHADLLAQSGLYQRMHGQLETALPSIDAVDD